MNKSALLASTAIGLLLCIAPANAQMQQKGSEEKAAPQQGPTTGPQKEQGPAEKKAEPKGKGAAQGEMKEQPGKGTAQTAPKEGKGTAEKAAEPKDKATKGTAEKSGEPKDKATKGTAEKAPEPKDKATKGAGAEPKDKAGSANRVQLTEEKRTTLGQTLTKESNLNRANKINVSVNIGTRLPNSVHLVALPASIIAIVPEYRTYRYVVVNDQICIVEPNSYEIVEVVPVSGQTAARSGPATLVLTEEERAVILREVDTRGGSTMGLGAITEGADVPRDARLTAFPDSVVQKVPKVKGHKFFTAENRLAIVDPQGTKVQLVIEQRR
jgi:Protein of unknown function (DUF1236)